MAKDYLVVRVSGVSWDDVESMKKAIEEASQKQAEYKKEHDIIGVPFAIAGVELIEPELFYENAVKLAKEELEETSGVSPKLLWLSPSENKNTVNLSILPLHEFFELGDYGKDMLKMTASGILEQDQAYAMVWLSEGWTVALKSKAEIAHIPRPGEHPDRIEVIITRLETKKRFVSRIFKLEREGKKARWGELFQEFDSDQNQQAKGRLMNFLYDPEQGSQSRDSNERTKRERFGN